jgi:hypothetical protein
MIHSLPVYLSLSSLSLCKREIKRDFEVVYVILSGVKDPFSYLSLRA